MVEDITMHSLGDLVLPPARKYLYLVRGSIRLRLIFMVLWGIIKIAEWLEASNRSMALIARMLLLLL